MCPAAGTEPLRIKVRHIGLSEVAVDQLREAEQTAPAWLLHRAETIVPIPGTTSVAICARICRRLKSA